MLITLLSIAVVIISFIGIYWLNKTNPFNRKTRENIVATLAFLIMMFGVISFVCCVPRIFVVNLNTEQKIYKNSLERESIVKQLESINSNYEDVSKIDVIARVYEYNKDVYNNKYWASNIWTNWFYDQKFVSSLEYIEMED